MKVYNANNELCGEAILEMFDNVIKLSVIDYSTSQKTVVATFSIGSSYSILDGSKILSNLQKLSSAIGSVEGGNSPQITSITTEKSSSSDYILKELT